MSLSAEQKKISESITAPTILTRRLQWAIDYWRPRNEYIAQVRDALEGLNKINVPVSAQYKAKAVHLYLIAAILNEKTARFLDIPRAQVIIDDPTDNDAVAFSSELEQALNIAAYEMERKGDGDVWSRGTSDLILLDEMVEKIQLISKSDWKELSEHDTKLLKAKADGKPYDHPLLGDIRTDYKKEYGIPIRSLYVPLEYFLPIYDGSRLDESFEVEGRSLKACLDNPLFDKEVLGEIPEDSYGGLSTVVPIIHYCDEHYYCSFTTTSSNVTYNTGASVTRLKPESMSIAGELVYLYGYEHGLGRSIYNCVAGRYGGWKTQHNRIEAVNKGILELSQAADELFSQVLTNTGAKYWPNLVFKVNPEYRPANPLGKPPEPPEVQSGQSITLFKDEELEPIFKAEEDPIIHWTMDIIKDQLSKLGGSAVLSGNKQPGVDSGYQYAQQISQAEHIDEKIEQHMRMGAVQHFTIMMLYIRKLGEKVWTHYSETDQSDLKGRKLGKYISIDPKSLYPLPRIDARVRKPRPIDFLAAIRAAREASDDRQGKGPVLSDLTIRTDIMAIESPNIEERLVELQTQWNELKKSGIIQQKIGQAVGLKLAKKGVPQPTPEAVAGVDPALHQAIQQVGQAQAAGAGGIGPDILRQVQEQMNNLNMKSGGMVTGESQPEARLGESIAGAQSV